MGLKGRYVCMPFETINEYETALTRFVLIRICPRISVYLSEDFVFLVPFGDYQGILKRRRVPLRTQAGTTVIQTRNSYHYLRLQR